MPVCDGRSLWSLAVCRQADARFFRGEEGSVLVAQSAVVLFRDDLDLLHNRQLVALFDGWRHFPAGLELKLVDVMGGDA